MAIANLRIRDKVDAIHTKADLAEFVRDLHADLCRNPERWENANLADFLAAMAAWIDDIDGYYRNRGEAVPDQPNWRVIADILMGAKVYS